MNNLIGLIIAFSYIFAAIGLAEGLRRWRGYGSGFTRKVIHIGVGMLSWLVPFLFDSPWPFVFACFVFVVINLLDYKYGFMAAMASSDRSNLGCRGGNHFLGNPTSDGGCSHAIDVG
ncbi:MAG: hypothetical protein PVJ75_01800 [Chloroflexota bacterium]|jgi:hypothetical protein